MRRNSSKTARKVGAGIGAGAGEYQYYSYADYDDSEDEDVVAEWSKSDWPLLYRILDIDPSTDPDVLLLLAKRYVYSRLCSILFSSNYRKHLLTSSFFSFFLVQPDNSNVFPFDTTPADFPMIPMPQRDGTFFFSQVTLGVIDDDGT